MRVFRSPRAVNLGVFLGRARAVALSGRGGLVVEDVLRMEARPRELGRGSNGGGHAVLVQGFGFGKVDDVEEHLLVGAMIARAEVEPQAVPRGARVVANRELVLALGEHLARAEVAALEIRRELRGGRRRKRRSPGTPTRAAKDGRRARENGVRGATTLSTPGASDERVAFVESCSATMDIAGGESRRWGASLPRPWDRTTWRKRRRVGAHAGTADSPPNAPPDGPRRGLARVRRAATSRPRDRASRPHRTPRCATAPDHPTRRNRMVRTDCSETRWRAARRSKLFGRGASAVRLPSPLVVVVVVIITS